jgi:arylsulfatase
VRIDHWKAIRTTRGKKVGEPAKTELYDLAANVAEMPDVAADHPDVVAKAEQVMKEQHTEWTPGKEKAAGKKE